MSTLHSFQILSAFHWLHFQLAACLEPYSEILQPVSPPSHHPHQTPSLCPFRADFVTRQMQVHQGRVLLEAFGQGLTGEIWTSSPALESIKLQVFSFLPSFSRIFVKLLNQGMRDETYETQSMGFAWFWYAICFFLTSNLLTFAH